MGGARPFSSPSSPASSSAIPVGPATVEMAFAPAGSLAAARAYTWRLAHSHYENFTVVSVLLPSRIRQDFCNIYAFCRTADDLGDEIPDRDRSLQLLNRFRDETLAMYAGRPQSLIFQALAETVQRHAIPPAPFLDLIDAFEQDQRLTRYADFPQLLDYCRRSANPVGRLVLYLCGYTDSARQHWSDATCTALQLANFWQDVRPDLDDRDRIYLPQDTMARFGVTEDQLRAGICTDAYRAALKFEVDRAGALFDEGDALLPSISPWCRGQISLFGQGGRAILQAIRRQDYDTLSARPSLSRWQKGRLILYALAARVVQVAQKVASPHEDAAPAAVPRQQGAA